MLNSGFEAVLVLSTRTNVCIMIWEEARNIDEDRAVKIYKAIKNYIEKNGFSPSVRELCKLTGINSISTITSYLNKLEEGGYIKRKPKIVRNITLTDKQTEKNERN
jgi:SOS-response transcriptional repressor LexA